MSYCICMCSHVHHDGVALRRSYEAKLLDWPIIMYVDCLPHICESHVKVEVQIASPHLPKSETEPWESVGIPLTMTSSNFDQCGTQFGPFTSLASFIDSLQSLLTALREIGV